MGFNFNGCIQEIPGISVDCFDNDKFHECSTFFLTHCHSDHMKNLFMGFKSFLRTSNSSLKLYCTVDSETILRNMAPFALGDDGTAVLDQTVTKMVFDREYDLDIDGFQVKATAIRANHCAGSCMFLFKTECSTVLFTGDFRYYPKQLRFISALHDEDNNKIQLDNIYLDTTFLRESTKSFPTRRQVLLRIIEEIEDFREGNPKSNVHIKRPANLGSELIIKVLAKEFGCKIHVEDYVYDLYEGIHHVHRHLTTDPYETFIHMCKLGAPGTEKRACQQSHALKIHPTALWFAYQNSPKWVQSDDKGRVKIAHSMHASGKELKGFINYFRPGEAVALACSDDGSIEDVQEELDKLVLRSSR
ncbi:Hypothetical predicted protein [Cloeon dipterum]|uniref:Protein artemis n=1 Tax=Cloeon dipterum TaxID=197152 RepID=A0A8S1DRB2_9INSE|nr:Hypothetical predicted protein [Cloeon dipterum]